MSSFSSPLPYSEKVLAGIDAVTGGAVSDLVNAAQVAREDTDRAAQRSG